MEFQVVLEFLEEKQLNYCTSAIKAVKVETKVPSWNPQGHS